jgi:hypothetical protein
VSIRPNQHGTARREPMHIGPATLGLLEIAAGPDRKCGQRSAADHR